MQTYIALLRGINVSGQKKIRMADLRGHLKALTFQAVQTWKFNFFSLRKMKFSTEKRWC